MLKITKYSLVKYNRLLPPGNEATNLLQILTLTCGLYCCCSAKWRKRKTQAMYAIYSSLLLYWSNFIRICFTFISSVFTYYKFHIIWSDIATRPLLQISDFSWAHNNCSVETSLVVLWLHHFDFISNLKKCKQKTFAIIMNGCALHHLFQMTWNV